jgi:cytochrome c oxidase subunit II
MMEGYFRLFPEAASTIAGRVDGLFGFLIGVSLFFTALIFALLLVFAIRYRRRSEDEQPPQIERRDWLEVTWIIIPLGLVMVMFGWGAKLYFNMMNPPDGALEIYAIGKQWMWKFQHPEGPREINELHVPVGHPVKMTMTSQDVIHSFFVPAFRVKMDVVPGRFTHIWFEATKPGVYHLFCAEYCGTMHSGMRGRVIAMRPTLYEEWLRSHVRGEPMASIGESLFEQLGCPTCHRADGGAPSLVGLFGTAVPLQSGTTVTADESYLRESILNPRAKIVAGYQPIMPTFQGQINAEELTQLISYIKSPGPGQKDGS